MVLFTSSSVSTPGNDKNIHSNALLNHGFSGHFCGMAEMLTPVSGSVLGEFTALTVFVLHRWTILAVAQSGLRTNGRVSSRYDGSLFETFQTLAFATSASSTSSSKLHVYFWY